MFLLRRLQSGIRAFLPSQRRLESRSACFCRKDFVKLLSDAYEGCAFTEFLEFEGPDVRTRRTKASENLCCRVVDGATIRDLHRLALGRPEIGVTDVSVAVTMSHTHTHTHTHTSV